VHVQFSKMKKHKPQAGKCRTQASPTSSACPHDDVPELIDTSSSHTSDCDAEEDEAEEEGLGEGLEAGSEKKSGASGAASGESSGSESGEGSGEASGEDSMHERAEPESDGGEEEEDDEDGSSSDSGTQSDDDDSDEDGSEKLFIDANNAEVLLYSSSEITVRDLAQVLQSLQTSAKLADAVMIQIVALLKAILPSGHALNDEKQLRKLVEGLLPPIQCIHACADDHVLFTGKYEHLLHCPYVGCGLPRYYVESDEMPPKPVKVFRYIPLKRQFQLLFANIESATTMRLNPTCCANTSRSDVPVADITESIGFKEKVFDSKFMKDMRNPIAILATDGFNPVAKLRVSKLSVWPFLMTFANRERSIRNKHENVLLVGLVPGHVFIGGKKRVQGPKSLKPYIEFILNEFCDLNGLLIYDASYPTASPQHQFKMSVVLLGTVTDFDGLGKLLNMVGAGNTRCCPKCHIRGTFFRSVRTRVFSQSRRYLPQDSKLRDEHPRESRSPPRPRTHVEMQSMGARAAKLMHQRPKKYYKRHIKKTGIVDRSPLASLPGFDCVDQCFLDLMHLIANIVNCHTMTRIGGRSGLPVLPVNKMKSLSHSALVRMSKKKRDTWQQKFNARAEDVRQLREVRDQIIEDDALWEISKRSMVESTSRLSALVCPSDFYSQSKPVWEYTGSWKTNDWQHFMERIAAFALYDCLDDLRYSLVIECYDVLSVLCRYSHRRSELLALKVRAVDMLSRYDIYGPVQDQSCMFHLVIHLIDQAIRWGPPAAVWMYPFERFLNYIGQQIKSKRHMEANICSRYRKAQCANMKLLNPAFVGLFMGSSPSNIRADSFPQRARGDKYKLVGSDLEEVHNVLKERCPLYMRVWQEWCKLDMKRNELPGAGIYAWKPWADGSADAVADSFQTGNANVSLGDALSAFRFESCRKIKSGVWHSGERREGCLTSSEPHKKAQSVFKFNSGHDYSFGRILFFFECIVKVTGTPQSLRFAKVQILLFSQCDPKCKLPVLSMHPSNREVIVEMRHIGPVIVCAQHPDQKNFTPTDFLLLPWPRHVDSEH
jgi:hypothetical protein